MTASKPTRLLSRALCLAFVAATASVAYGAAAGGPPTLATAQQKLATMSVPFVPNAGQWDSRAAFAAQTFAGTLFVTKAGELVYSLPPVRLPSPLRGEGLGERVKAAHAIHVDSHANSPLTPTLSREGRGGQTGWVLSETLVDAKGNPRAMRQSTLKAPAGYRPMEGKVSYAIGSDTSKHADNLNTYERVNLGDMYPGVNVQLRATGNNVEKIFTVAPRHDPKQIHIKLAGANQLEIGTQGELIAHTGNGPVAFTAPIAFQETANGERTAVQVAYALNADQQRYHFRLGAYDVNQPLVIDPLLQSTYLGGSGSDYAVALAIHPATGEVYIAGYTNSTDLPSVTPGSGGVATGAQSASGGGLDAFVSRFNAALTTRSQSSYLGGTGTDAAVALAIHPATGEVYIAGTTTSTDLPSVTPGSGGVATGAQSAKSTGYDAFVTRFNAALTTRSQSSYLGGTGTDYANALAIHPATSEVYIAGYTNSADLPSVTTASGGVATGAQSASGGGQDAFVTRFNAALTTRSQSSYLGGTGVDVATALAIHPATGEVYIAGYTESTDLPSVTTGSGGVATGAQSVKSTDFDAFVTRFNAALTTRSQSSYLGGTGTDQALALAIHPATGEVYIAGQTDSTDLPSVTTGSGGVATGAQSAKSTGTDAFVSRFSTDLTAVNRTPNPFSFLHQSNVPPNSTRTSNEVRLIITPNPGDNHQAAYVTGTAGSELCVANQPGICVTPYVACALPCYGTNWFVGPWDFVSGDYIAVRHSSAASGTAETKLIISGTAYPFRSSTGNANIACNLDMNADNNLSATLEGLILVRAMLGFSSAATVAGTGVTQGSWDAMRPQINANCGTNF